MSKNDFKFQIYVPNKNKPIKFSMPSWGTYLLFMITLSSIVLFIFSLIYGSYITRRLVSYEALKMKVVWQDRQLSDFGVKVSNMTAGLDEVSQNENRIRKLLGLKLEEPIDVPVKSKTILRTKKTSIIKKVVVSKESMPEIKKNIKSNKKEIEKKKMSLKTLMQFVDDFRKKFAFTPSIWPIKGPVMSTFGFRTDPWRGFHSGLDISAPMGSPVKVAADGIVNFTGSKPGYGTTVIIDHGFGTMTLYGHLSRYKVFKGEKVKKGDVIAYVGMTGFATGPHLHFETILNGAQVNPANFLKYEVINLSNADMR